MSDFLGPLILVTFCFLVSYWERSWYGTAVTPFGVMAWPYIIIVCMINFIGKYFGFFPVSMQSIGFVLLCFIFFLIGSRGIIKILGKGINVNVKSANNDTNIEQLFSLYRPLFVTLAVISIIAGFIHFFQSINEVGGWSNIGSMEFDIAYGTGILAHIQNLSRPAFIFLFADYMKNRRKLIFLLILLIFVVVLARQVKYHVIVLLLSGLYFSYYCNCIKFTLRKLVVSFFAIYFIFNVTYTIGFSVLSSFSNAYSLNVQNQLFNLFFTYLFGGIIAFSEILKTNFYPLYSLQEIMAVPINFMKFLEGDPRYVDIIIRKWIDVSNIYQNFHSSNVFTMFGMLWIYIGSLLTFIYLFLLGIFFYFIFFLANKNSKYVGFQLTNVFFMAFITLSFFGLYFNKIFFYEVVFYMLFFPPLYSTLSNLYEYALKKHKLNLLYKFNIQSL